MQDVELLTRLLKALVKISFALYSMYTCNHNKRTALLLFYSFLYYVFFCLLSFLNLLLPIYRVVLMMICFLRGALSLLTTFRNRTKSPGGSFFFHLLYGDRPAPRFVLSRLVVVVMVSSTRHVPYFHPVGFIRRV